MRTKAFSGDGADFARYLQKYYSVHKPNRIIFTIIAKHYIVKVFFFLCALLFHSEWCRMNGVSNLRREHSCRIPNSLL